MNACMIFKKTILARFFLTHFDFNSIVSHVDQIKPETMSTLRVRLQLQLVSQQQQCSTMSSSYSNVVRARANLQPLTALSLARSMGMRKLNSTSVDTDTLQSDLDNRFTTQTETFVSNQVKIINEQFSGIPIARLLRFQKIKRAGIHKAPSRAAPPRVDISLLQYSPIPALFPAAALNVIMNLFSH